MLKPQFNQFMKSTSLQRVLVMPLLFLMIVLALLISFISYQAGQQITDDLSQKILFEITDRIHQATERHLLGSQTALKAIVPDMLGIPTRLDQAEQIHLPFTQNIEKLEEYFWLATGLFPESNHYVFFGGEDGRFIGVNRLADNRFELRLRKPNENVRHIYQMAGPQKRIVLLRTDDYDPRKRPWYISAKRGHKAQWSPTYIDFTTHEPILTLTKAVYDQQQNFMGVAATDLSLRHLTDFLHSLPISKNGVAFIAEKSGLLIASSTEELPYTLLDNEKPERLHAEKSHIPLIAKSYQQLSLLFNQTSTNNKVWFDQIEFENAKVQLAAKTLTDDAGLNWVIVVAVPRPDLMTYVTEHLYRNLLVGVVLVLIVIALGFLLMQRFLGDIKKLAKAADNMGQDDSWLQIMNQRGDEIGQLAKRFQRIEKHLQTDRLTGVLNRDAFIERINRICSQKLAEQTCPFALFVIDLDDFRYINEYYGYDHGNQVLIEMSHRLNAALHENDLLARLDGDEFVICLPGQYSDDDLEYTRQQLQQALEKPISIADDMVDWMSASIGIAHCPLDGHRLETLLALADQRMLEIKRLKKSEHNNAAERARLKRLEYLLAAIGHELRSPLQAISGSAKILERLNHLANQDQQTYLHIIQDSSNQLAHLVDDLIGLARHNKLSYVPTLVKTQTWLASLVDRYLIEAKNKQLQLCVDAEELPDLYFDATRLTQCVGNLLANAIRYTEVGKITLSIRWLSEAQNDKGKLEIKVSDTGEGISTENQAHIFQPFFRASTHQEGMGLGLAIVLAIVKSAQGHISLQSELGQGSTFTLQMPTQKSNVLEQTNTVLDVLVPTKISDTVALKQDDHNLPKILIVDDDKAIRTVLTGMVAHMGYASDMAANGEEALVKLRDQSYQIIITDLQMPVLNGFELAKNCKQNLSPCPRLIAMTAYSKELLPHPQLDVFDAILTKPIDDEMLLIALEGEDN